MTGLIKCNVRLLHEEGGGGGLSKILVVLFEREGVDYKPYTCILDGKGM